MRKYVYIFHYTIYINSTGKYTGSIIYSNIYCNGFTLLPALPEKDKIKFRNKSITKVFF